MRLHVGQPNKSESVISVFDGMTVTMPTASPNARSSLVWLLVACCFLLAPPALAGKARHVLVLYSNNRLLPANLEFEAGLRETLVNSAESSAGAS